jgi:ankyrin repeat protein
MNKEEKLYSKILDTINFENFNKFKELFSKEYWIDKKVSNCYVLDIFLLASLSSRKKDIFKFLLDNGANPNGIMHRQKYFVPLISMYIEDDYDYANDVDNFEKIKDMNIYLSNTEMLELLIEVGADVNKPSEYGLTPLDHAVRSRHRWAVKVLKKHNAVFSKNFLDESYIKYYPKKDPYKEKYIVTEWVDKTLTPFEREIDRIHRNHLRGCELDLGFLPEKYSYGFNPNQKNYLGRTALDYALELNYQIIIDYLRSVGGKTSKELDENNE